MDFRFVASVSPFNGGITQPECELIILKEEVFFPAGLRLCVPKCTDESRSKIVDFYAMKTSKVCRR